MRLNRRAATGRRGRAGWLGIVAYPKTAASRNIIGRFLDHIVIAVDNGTQVPVRSLDLRLQDSTSSHTAPRSRDCASGHSMANTRSMNLAIPGRRSRADRLP